MFTCFQSLPLELAFGRPGIGNLFYKQETGSLVVGGEECVPGRPPRILLSYAVHFSIKELQLFFPNRGGVWIPGTAKTLMRLYSIGFPSLPFSFKGSYPTPRWITWQWRSRSKKKKAGPTIDNWNTHTQPTTYESHFIQGTDWRPAREADFQVALRNCFKESKAGPRIYMDFFWRGKKYIIEHQKITAKHRKTYISS